MDSDIDMTLGAVNTIAALICSVIRFAKLSRSSPSGEKKRGLYCVEHIFTLIPTQSINVKSLAL
jgi:hypothetical protein